MSEWHRVELDDTSGTLTEHDDDSITLRDEVEDVVRLASEFWAAEKPASLGWLLSNIRDLLADNRNPVEINHPEHNLEPFVLHLTERHPRLVIGLRGVGLRC
jgi:hypothetical protein